MKTINVLAMAPYEGLGLIFTDCAKSFPEIRLNVLIGNLQVALQNLQSCHDYDIVISRGGTAQVLRQELSTPVIEVEISVYDMLRVIKMAQQTGKHFAIMGFPSVTRTARIICEILQYDMPIFTINSEADAEKAMSKLAESKIDLVIGDVVVTDTAREAGVDSLLITSGFESVEEAFVDIMRLFNSMEKIQRASPYRDILENVPMRVALFDSNKRLAYTNLAFEKQPLKELETLLREYIPRTETGSPTRFHKRLGNQNIHVTGVRLQYDSDCWYTFYVTNSALGGESEACLKIENSTSSPRTAIGFEFLGAEKARTVLLKAAQCNMRQAPILLTGEAGTGLDACALYIHSSGDFKNSLFITIDCPSVNEKRWQEIIDNADSPIHGLNCTIYFKNIHELSPQLQKTLCDYANDTLLTKRHYVISSATVDLPHLISGGEFLLTLHQMLNGLSIQLPSLRECSDELPAIVSLLISQYNMEFARQVIGFEEGALEYLKSFHWETNLEQLRDTIRQLMIVAGGSKSYFSLRDVQSVLSIGQKKGVYSPEIDLNRTYAEIERDILTHVLAAEGMNQTRAAKRLGIGRSTLWRKITGAPE